MSNIREIPLEPANAEVIECLELALEAAKLRGISMLALTIIERDGHPRFVKSQVHNWSLMIGAMSRHLWRISSEADD